MSYILCELLEDIHQYIDWELLFTTWCKDSDTSKRIKELCKRKMDNWIETEVRNLLLKMDLEYLLYPPPEEGYPYKISIVHEFGRAEHGYLEDWCGCFYVRHYDSKYDAEVDSKYNNHERRACLRMDIWMWFENDDEYKRFEFDIQDFSRDIYYPYYFEDDEVDTFLIKEKIPPYPYISKEVETLVKSIEYPNSGDIYSDFVEVLDLERWFLEEYMTHREMDNLWRIIQFSTSHDK